MVLTTTIAQVYELKFAEFFHTFGDTHIYNNDFEQLELQLSNKTE